MELNELSYKIIGCAYEVHKNLGAGLLESTYEACLCQELASQDIHFERQKELPIFYKGKKLDKGYVIDILVENTIIIELKAVDALLPIHTAQTMTYLKLSKRKLGLLINFNVLNLQKGIRRIIL